MKKRHFFQMVAITKDPKFKWVVGIWPQRVIHNLPKYV